LHSLRALLRLRRLRRELRQYGAYQIKHASFGWWVDGSCGYKVHLYYHETEVEAIAAALGVIRNPLLWTPGVFRPPR
jgi:hypothetical protein